MRLDKDVWRGSIRLVCMVLPFLYLPSLSATPYTYRCDFDAEFGDKVQLHLQWDDAAYNIAADISPETDKWKSNTEHVIHFKGNSYVTKETGQGIDRIPFFVISGTHGGGEFLRGFFVQPRKYDDLSALWIDTSTGEASLHTLGLTARAYSGNCTSLGLGKSFPGNPFQ